MTTPTPIPAPYTFDRVVRMVLSAAALVAIFVLLRLLSDVLLPFAAAVVLAYLLNPLVTLFERKTRRRWLAVGVTVGGLGLMGATMLILLIPLVISQADRFRDDLNRLTSDLSSSSAVSPNPSSAADDSASEAGSDAAEQKPSDPIAAAAKSTLGWRELVEGWAEYRRDPGRATRAERLRQLRRSVQGTFLGQQLDAAVAYTKTDEFRALLVDAAKSVALGGWSVVSFGFHLVVGATGLIIVLVYLVFLLIDFPQYARQWKAFLPPPYRATIVEFLEQFNLALRRYFRGQSVVALLTGTLYVIGFTLIGLPMAVPLGLFIGVLNMVPYLSAVALVPALGLAGLRAVEGDAGFVMSIVFVLLVFAVVQVIQDTLITPRVMGEATGLKPVAILLGVFVWGKLLGFLGLLLAIPLTCLGIAYYRRYVLLHAVEVTKRS